jgi:hypothetical protein
VPVQERIGCQYIIFHFVLANNFLMGLPVQNVLPVCFKSDSVSVQKHTVCQYIIFHFVLAEANFGMPVQKIVFCTGMRIGIFMMGGAGP